MGAAVAIKSASQPAGLAVKVDRCAYLLAQAAKNKPWMDELATLKLELQEACEDRSDKAVRLKGQLYYVDLKPREWQRSITDPQKAWAACKSVIGLADLVGLMRIPFKILDPLVSKQKQAAFVITERSGPRDITAGLLKSPLAAA